MRLGLAAALGAPLAACGGAPAWRGLAKVGLVLSFRGPDPAAAMATHVAVRDLLIERNLLGGLGGHRLELVSLDDEADTAVARRRVAELVLDPLVVAALVQPGVDPAGLVEAGMPHLILQPMAAERVLGAIEAARRGQGITRQAVMDELRRR